METIANRKKIGGETLSAYEKEKSESISKLRDKVELMCSEYAWFKSVEIESDDGGAHLTVKVYDVKSMTSDNINLTMPGIKTCIIFVDREKPKDEMVEIKGKK